MGNVGTVPTNLFYNGVDYATMNALELGAASEALVTRTRKLRQSVKDQKLSMDEYLKEQANCNAAMDVISIAYTHALDRVLQ
jgi:translation initiation factor IF-2